MKITKNKAIILFDGVCNLCNTSVQYIIKKDATDYFRFASLQSDFSKEILKNHDYKSAGLDSILLIEDGKIYTKSSAALRIAKKLSGIVKLTYIGILFPKFFRDFLYAIVAKYRYNWFGKKKECMIPSSAIKNKFLD